MILVIGTAIGIWFVMRYAARVKADPSASLVADKRAENEARFLAATDGGRDAASPAGSPPSSSSSSWRSRS